MSFKAVDPIKLDQLLKPEDKLQVNTDGTYTLPTKTLYVTLEDGTRVGEIEYPLDFCTMDKGACGGQAAGLDTGSGFARYGGGAGTDATPEIWYHMDCFRPTRSWFTGHIKRVVKFYGEIPW